MSEVEKLKKDIRFKELCIQHTDKWIKNPAEDTLSKIMIEQSFRLEAELEALKEKLKNLITVKSKPSKPKKKSSKSRR